MLIHVIWVVSDPSSNLGLQRAVAGRYKHGGGCFFCQAGLFNFIWSDAESWIMNFCLISVEVDYRVTCSACSRSLGLHSLLSTVSQAPATAPGCGCRAQRAPARPGQGQEHWGGAREGHRGGEDQGWARVCTAGFPEQPQHWWRLLWGNLTEECLYNEMDLAAGKEPTPELTVFGGCFVVFFFF